VPVFLPVIANWSSQVSETYEFATSIFTSENGDEQRRSQIAIPRRTLRMGVLLDGDRRGRFAAAIARALDGDVEIPDHAARQTRTTVAAPEGTSMLTVNVVPAWLTAGTVVALANRRALHRLVVDSVSGNNVILAGAGAPADVAPQSLLLPVLRGTLVPRTTLTMHTAGIAETQIEVQQAPGTAQRSPSPLPFEEGDPLPQIAGGAGLLEGRYVLLRKPNYASAPQIEFSLPYRKVDYNRGVSRTFAPVPIISRTVTASYFSRDRSEALALLDIFLRCRGRAGEIYVPTWSEDIPRPIAISGSSMTFAGTDLATTFGSDAAHRAVLIQTSAGQLAPREITSIVASGGNSVVTCRQPVEVEQSAVRTVSWMFLARFAQDALTVDWRTDSVADISLSFTTLANVPVEVLLSNWILATGYWDDGGEWIDTSVWND